MDILEKLDAKLAPYRKLVVYILGMAGVLLSAGLVPVDLVGIVSYVLAVAGALGLYAAPNAPLPDTRDGA